MLFRSRNRIRCTKEKFKTKESIIQAPVEIRGHINKMCKNCGDCTKQHEYSTDDAIDKSDILGLLTEQD